MTSGTPKVADGDNVDARSPARLRAATTRHSRTPPVLTWGHAMIGR
jgi:hypothetical protein